MDAPFGAAMSELDPSVDPAVPPVAPPPVLVKRRFAWGTFFVGVAAGVVGTVAAIVLAGVVLAYLVSRMAGGAGVDASMTAPAPDLPTGTPLPVYGLADRGWTFHTLDGEPATLGSFTDKVVVLNFWATWCGPCVAEMPSLERLRGAVAGDPVAIVLVSDEDAPTIRAFLTRKAMALTSYRSQGPTPRLFETDGIPTTFIVAPNGRVVVRHVGMAKWDDPSVVTFIRNLVSAK
jgi:thiol-disulfide isomerase/thioredoxin